MARVNDICIKIQDYNNSILSLQIIPDKEDTFHVVSEDEAHEYGEVCYQIEEGRSYEYYMQTEGFCLAPVLGIITPFKSSRVSGGRITPGNYTGTLTLTVCISKSMMEVGIFKLEVRSVKTSYRNDYRIMMEEIAEVCTDLVLLHSSPTTQYLTPSFLKDSQTLYQ